MYGMGSDRRFFCHLYIGEAVVVGMQLALTRRSGHHRYRDHGHMIACGMDP